MREAYRETAASDFWIGAAGRAWGQDTNRDRVVRDRKSGPAAFGLYRGSERSRGVHLTCRLVRVYHYSFHTRDNSETDRRCCFHRRWNLDDPFPVSSRPAKCLKRALIAYMRSSALCIACSIFFESSGMDAKPQLTPNIMFL